MLDILRYYLNLLAVKTGKGQGLVEYALIIVLISIVAIAIMTTLGASITSVFSTANSSLDCLRSSIPTWPSCPCGWLTRAGTMRCFAWASTWPFDSRAAPQLHR